MYHLRNIFRYRDSVLFCKDWHLLYELKIIAGPNRESYVVEQVLFGVVRKIWLGGP